MTEKSKNAEIGNIDFDSLEVDDPDEMSEVINMMKRIQSSWEHKPDKEQLLEELLDMMVLLGVYPSRYQRPVWHEPGLTARPLWTLDQLGQVTSA